MISKLETFGRVRVRGNNAFWCGKARNRDGLASGRRRALARNAARDRQHGTARPAHNARRDASGQDMAQWATGTRAKQQDVILGTADDDPLEHVAPLVMKKQ
jgi:hypothetical protein